MTHTKGEGVVVHRGVKSGHRDITEGREYVPEIRRGFEMQAYCYKLSFANKRESEMYSRLLRYMCS